MDILQALALPSAWIALLALIFMEIVLGIDNVVFLSITTSRLPVKKRPVARDVGMILATIVVISLLFGISFLMRLSKPVATVDLPWLKFALSWQGIIIFAGGLFLIYKSVAEVHNKLHGRKAPKAHKARSSKFWEVIAQVIILDLIFSFDNLMTAVGMIGFDTYGYAGSMFIMITAIVISVVVMLVFSGWIGKIMTKYPTIQMLGLSFLMLIAVMLLVEAAHLSNLEIFGSRITEMPRGYIYFAIAFSLMVEVFNIRARRKRRK